MLMEKYLATEGMTTRSFDLFAIVVLRAVDHMPGQGRSVQSLPASLPFHQQMIDQPEG